MMWVPLHLILIVTIFGALNARRQLDDNTPLDDFTGPTTYLHYEDSPNILNRENNVFESVIFNSLSDKSVLQNVKY